MRTRPALLLIIGALGASGCERAQPSRMADSEAVTTTVRQLEERLRAAMVASDTAVLGSLWAPEYVSTSAVGHTSNRTESLVAYGSRLVKVDSAAVRDLDVRSYGTTAVSLGLLDWGGTAAGQQFASTVRFQHVWVLSNGSWRLVASQLTSQPPRGAAPPAGRDSAAR